MQLSSLLAHTREVCRRKHLACGAEEAYTGWIRRYASFLSSLKQRKQAQGLSSEAKFERFLTRLATSGCAASTQNQAPKGRTFTGVMFPNFCRTVSEIPPPAELKFLPPSNMGKVPQMNARPPDDGAAMDYLTPVAAVPDRRGGLMDVRAAGNRGLAGGEAPAVMVRCQRS